MKTKQVNRYQALIADIFFHFHNEVLTVIPFTRVELIANAEKLGIVLPKNPGDILYSFRYRNPLPEVILKTQPKGMEWVMRELAGPCTNSVLFRSTGSLQTQI